MIGMLIPALADPASSRVWRNAPLVAARGRAEASPSPFKVSVFPAPMVNWELVVKEVVSSSQMVPPLATVIPMVDLPLFAAADDPGALPTTAPAEGRILTFDQLAHLLRRQRPRRRVVPEGQLALFGT